jgi:hypothetical protein
LLGSEKCNKGEKTKTKTSHHAVTGRGHFPKSSQPFASTNLLSYVGISTYSKKRGLLRLQTRSFIEEEK